MKPFMSRSPGVDAAPLPPPGQPAKRCNQHRPRSSQGEPRRILSRTKPAPSRSWILAECTTTRIGSPSLSTRAWILRPLPACRRHNPPGRRYRLLFGRFDRLAVENRSGRAGLASRPLAERHMQLSQDGLPDALTLELAKDVVDRRAWRKAVAREIAPGAAGAQQIENGIYRRSHVGLAWSAARQCLWDQWCHPRLLRISEIARVARALAPINPTVLLRPHRC